MKHTAQAQIVKVPRTLRRRYLYRVTSGAHEGLEFAAEDDGDLNDGHVGSVVTIEWTRGEPLARRSAPTTPQGFQLKTPALVTFSDSPPREHRARVEYNRIDGTPALVVESTPGRWSLSTLIGLDGYGGYSLRSPHALLAIDLGQRWIVTNAHALVSEALARVLGENPPAPGACLTCKGDGGACIVCRGTGVRP